MATHSSILAWKIPWMEEPDRLQSIRSQRVRHDWETSPVSGVGRRGFPGGSDGKESICNAGDLGSTPGLGRSPAGGHGNPLQYSCLESPVDRAAWRATVHGVTESDTPERISTASWGGNSGKQQKGRGKWSRKGTATERLSLWWPQRKTHSSVLPHSVGKGMENSDTKSWWPLVKGMGMLWLSVRMWKC